MAVKKAHKEASVAYRKKHPKKKETGPGCLADNAPIFFEALSGSLKGMISSFAFIKHLINGHVNHPVDCHRPAFIPTRGPTNRH